MRYYEYEIPCRNCGYPARIIERLYRCDNCKHVGDAPRYTTEPGSPWGFLAFVILILGMVLYAVLNDWSY